MSRTGVGCRVLIDGQVLDDGCLDWAHPPTPVIPEGVVASEGLVVAWGRSTTVDQPSPSTCTFTVIDEPGGSTVLETVTLGAQVDVYADAYISGGSGVNTFTDPDFSSELRTTTNNTTATRTADGEAGSMAARLVPVNAAQLAWVRMPPGTLQAEGTNPVAWAAIQTTLPGETWTIAARVNVPAGVTVTMRPVLYSGPYASAATVFTSAGRTTSTPGWQTLTLNFSPGTTAWVGLYFEMTGGGPTWASIGPDATWGTTAATVTWGGLSAVIVDSVQVTGPGGGTGVTVQVFSGRITDLAGSYDDGWDTPALHVTATDFLGDLGNRYIGTEPWPAEPVLDRVTRVLSLAASPGDDPIQIDVAASVAGTVMSWLDVDRRAAAGLLTDTAQSVDAVLWSSTHPVIGAYIRLEDPAERLALYQLALVGGLIVIVPIDFSEDPDAPPSLSACDILRDPVTFVNAVSDIATRTEVTWLAQVAGPPVSTTEESVSVLNAAAELSFGTRAVKLQSLLTTAEDARVVADQLLSRLGASWRIEGLAITDADVTVPDAAAARTLLMLLNGVTRGGQALLLTDLPEWSPTGAVAPIYLEGGTYGFVGGGWDLDLTVSRAAGIGQNAAWDEIPNSTAWVWDAWSPALTWNDLRGVVAP